MPRIPQTKERPSCSNSCVKNGRIGKPPPSPSAVKPLLVIRFALRVIRIFFTPPGDPWAAPPLPVIRFLSAALVVLRSQKWPFEPSRKTIDMRLLHWTDPGLYRPNPIAQGCQHEDSSTPTRQGQGATMCFIHDSGLSDRAIKTASPPAAFGTWKANAEGWGLGMAEHQKDHFERPFEIIPQ